MLASLDDDVDEGEEEFDFAKTEALPPEAFTGNTDLDETGEMPAVAETDVDLDLDDLTAALQVSAAGDTVEQPFAMMLPSNSRDRRWLTKPPKCRRCHWRPRI